MSNAEEEFLEKCRVDVLQMYNDVCEGGFGCVKTEATEQQIKNVSTPAQV